MKAHTPDHTAGKNGTRVGSRTSFLLHPPIGRLILPVPAAQPSESALLRCPHPPHGWARLLSGRQEVDFSREEAMGESLGWKGGEVRGRQELC